MAKKVTLYSTPFCAFCKMAKRLLTERGVEFEEKLLESTASPEFQELIAKSGLRTAPQIFVDDQLIGGYQELAAIDADDNLESLKN